MTDEVKDEGTHTASLEEMQRQIVDLQEQLRVIADESDAFLDTEKKEAISTLCRLPHNAESPITWSYGGAYRTPSGKGQSVSHSGRTALAISYPEPRMPRLRTSRVSSQIRPSSLF
jgi:hypothetical protein